jgi:Cu2+-exporting ATPase
MADALTFAESDRLPPRAAAADANVAAASSSRHTTTLVVGDMHCGGCMRKVELALCALPGVESARANLSAKRVAIVTTARPASTEPFIAALQAAGFAALELVDDSDRAAVAADQDYLKRLGVAGFAAANIMLLSVSVWSGLASDMPQSLQTLFHWLSAVIALPAVAYAGQPFFSSARKALSAGRLNMDVPISLGVILATAMSLYQTMRGSEQVYFDAAVTLLFFLLIGRALDQRMRARAAGAAQNLLALRSPAASVLHADGSTERIATKSVLPGMRILIAAGERIPVDARIARGSTEIDESLITGESCPRFAFAGDRLHAGTINLSGPIEAEVTAVAENTMLAEIARLMQIAEQARGRYVRLADRAARLYAPSVHVLGLATFAGWMLAGQDWEQSLTAAIAVLIITCPCALALAVPVVQVVAAGRLFRQGIVLKAADGLERFAEIDAIVLDKTGTLTLGSPHLVEDGAISDAALSRAASLAAASGHPYSRAIVRAARDRGLPVVPAEGVEETAGAGLRAAVDGRIVSLGTARHCGIDEEKAAPPTLWLRDGEAAPVPFHFEDTMREDAREIVEALRDEGYPVELVSGDRRSVTRDAAAAAAIESWRAEQRPDDKIARIKEYERSGRRVLMVGDGLNDAPALAAGHASISPSTAADISQTAADAVFQGRHLAPILETLHVARTARHLSLENFAIAIGYNFVFVPLAMAGQVTPLLAAIAMSASSIAVTANALRLSRPVGKGRS